MDNNIQNTMIDNGTQKTMINPYPNGNIYLIIIIYKILCIINEWWTILTIQ